MYANNKTLAGKEKENIFAYHVFAPSSRKMSEKSRLKL